jgi:ectoine hydroxylase-related dioxygenase (phytanoyl-CoA dioxygenase family)
VVRVRGLLSSEEVDELRNELERYEREIVPHVPPSDCIFEADGETVRNLFRMEEHDEYFAVFLANSEIKQLIAPLLHGKPIATGVETFNKPARVGSAVPPHQDNAYFCQSPPDMLTVWIALDAATVENGAVYYRKGSHHKLLPHAPSVVAGNSFGLADSPAPDADSEFIGTLQPGDALIHHCQIIHRSEPNRSEHPRRGLLIVYRGAHTQTDPNLKAAYECAQVAK